MPTIEALHVWSIDSDFPHPVKTIELDWAGVPGHTDLLLLAHARRAVAAAWCLWGAWGVGCVSIIMIRRGDAWVCALLLWALAGGGRLGRV